ncbi:MAG TPA: polysaccharide pyruvyl transferase family protein [Vicinamibacterales bacterium]|nr:polysaccharide pyruvyl transferase family protein [Vicinamibacterales bacterium]
MRILVDSCAYNCQNVGDLAMLTVAVSRLRELWPAATIQVITNAPDLVARHCGAVATAPVRGRRLVLQEHLLGPVRRMLPNRVRGRADAIEDRVRAAVPSLFALSARAKSALVGHDARDGRAFLDAVARADLVVVNGAGIITDAFRESALAILATLDLAMRRNVPAALFGQGLGPLKDPALARRAREVLPRVTQIAIRESRTSLPLLRALGVPAASIVVTGDDAIELAYPGRDQAESAGARKIGVNIRIAPYADVEQDTLSRLRDVLERAARRHDAELIPVPIAHHGGRMDVETLRELLRGVDDGGSSLDTPRKVIARVGECRVVVTGSYHGAVFALAQGIPAVALAKSQYYVNKMSGVAEQFGGGCEIVSMDHEGWPAQVQEAVDRAWRGAEQMREPLLAAAADQIGRSRAAYARLRTLLSNLPRSSRAGVDSVAPPDQRSHDRESTHHNARHDGRPVPSHR